MGNTRKSLALLAILSLFLAACGGGGDSTLATANETPPGREIGFN